MGTDSQILAAYNQGLSPEQISEDLGFPLYAIKAKLMSLSKQYREACGEEPEDQDDLNLSRAEQALVKRRLMETFMTTDDEHLICKLGTYLRDDGKGRKDAIKQMQGIGTMNILQLVNSGLSQAREGSKQLKEAIGV